MMKKSICILALVLVMVMSGCFGEKDNTESQSSTEDTSSSFVSQEQNQDETVFIVGQVAVSIQDRDSLSVQIQTKEGGWAIYHCQLKDEFLEEAKTYELTDVIKIKGLLLSKVEPEDKNAAIIVNLYDCEIVK